MRLPITDRRKFTDTYGKQFNIMNEYIIKQNTIDGVNFLEKQFNNKNLLHNWLVKYNRNVYDKKEKRLFEVECNTVCALLLFFRKLNLIEDSNIHFIETVIDNIELYITNISCNDLRESQNITKSCESYIRLNKIESIIKETDKSHNVVNTVLKETILNNTTEAVNSDDKIPDSFKFLNRNQNNSINKESVNSIETELQNTVDNNKIENISKNDKNLEKLNTVVSESTDLQNTVNDKKEIEKIIKKRKKYSKKNKTDEIKKTVHNIVNYNIKNKEIFDKSYKFNRNNIELFSTIYKKYKIDTVIDETEFDNIYKSFDKNKNRFLKICKFYYEIYNEKILFDSKLLFLPYCFNEISIKDDCIILFKELIIEFLNK